MNGKRMVVLVAAVVGLALSATVPAAAQRVTITPKLGLSLASWGGNDVDDLEDAIGAAIGGTAEFGTRTGFAAGASLSIGLGSGLGIRPELLFVQKGAGIDVSGSAGSGEGSFKQNYVEVPVLLEYRIWTPGIVVPSLFAGPALGFELSCDVEDEDGNSSTCDTVELDTKATDFGVKFGAGLGFKLGTGILNFEGSYTLGLTKFIDADPEPDLKLRALSLTAGFALPLGVPGVM